MSDNPLNPVSDDPTTEGPADGGADGGAGADPTSSI